MDREILENVGLSGKESEVYEALLAIGASSVSKISKHVDINRANVYDILERLMRKGLVDVVVSTDKKYFSAVTPEKLLKMLEARKSEIEDAKGKVNALIEKYKVHKEKEYVRFYKGKGGLRTIYEEMVTGELGRSIYAIGVTGITRELLHRWWWEKTLVGLLNKNNIKYYGLYYRSTKGKKLIEGQKNFHIKFLPEDVKYKSTTTYIYGNNIAIMSVDNLWGIIIEDSVVAEAYKQYFEILWGISSR